MDPQVIRDENQNEQHFLTADKAQTNRQKEEQFFGCLKFRVRLNRLEIRSLPQLPLGRAKE